MLFENVMDKEEKVRNATRDWPGSQDLHKKWRKIEKRENARHEREEAPQADEEGEEGKGEP